MLTKNEILKGLNRSQKEAVKNFEGPCFIEAGPGAGKTKVICSRAAYMIQQGIDPENIVIFTFTRKAAEEIRDRVDEQIGRRARYMQVGTYHSTCAKLLRRYARSVNRERNFSICDEEDKTKIMKEIIKDSRIKPGNLIGKISNWKNAMISPEEAAELMSTSGHLAVLEAEYYKQYERYLERHNLLDFDDLILYTIRLFDNDKAAKDEVNNRFRYIMADEAHDSAPKDIELILHLAGERRNLCMILDTDQSIYSFRGVDLEAILGVKSHFPGLKEFVLERNYRSTPNILNAARSLVAHNTLREDKELRTEKASGANPAFVTTRSPQHEADFVTRTVMFLNRKGIECKDIAVLYRAQYMSRAVEESFLKNGVDYVITGGHPFYSRKEVKDIMSYLRLLHNPSDVQAFQRIVNVPRRKIGRQKLDTIFSLANQEIYGIIDLIDTCRKCQYTEVNEFAELMEYLRDYSEEHGLSELLREVIRKTEYNKYLEKSEDNVEERKANLQELVNISVEYASLEDFLQNAVLSSQLEDQEEEQQGVRLMTLHASKGLEFKAVVLIGANEGTIPHNRAQADSEVQEERRLFYVGMTRAEDYLFITRPTIVYFRGMPLYAQPSRFIEEIDSSYLEVIDYT